MFDQGELRFENCISSTPVGRRNADKLSVRTARRCNAENALKSQGVNATAVGDKQMKDEASTIENGSYQLLYRLQATGGSPAIGEVGVKGPAACKIKPEYKSIGCGRAGVLLCALAPKWQTHNPIAMLVHRLLWLLLS